MRYVIIGAGAIGGSIGGRLFAAGRDVVLIARGSHLDRLRETGLRLMTPDSDEILRIPVVSGPAELGELEPDDVLVLCVKSQDSMSVLSQWATVPVRGGGRASELIPVVCAQNGVENERVAQRLFRTVYGMCVWLPATHLEPGVVIAQCAPLSGILTLGRFPTGSDDRVLKIGADLDASFFHAPVADDVMRWKYGKLLNNLANSLDAIADLHGAPDEAKTLLDGARAEAIAALRAAGIAFTNAEERAAVMGDRMKVQTVAGVPRSGSSSRQSLERGTGSIEADYLNGEVVMLGRMHGVPTPVNALLQSLANEFVRDGRAPGSMTVDEVRGLLEPGRDR
jgi:2-dehydropantoate 2-reductase